MNCADAVTRLSAALDGELTAGDAREVQQHLAGCDACARRYRTLQQMRTAVRSTPFAPVDAGRFDAAVLARVRHEPSPLRISGAWIAAAAALVIAVSSAVLMLQGHSGVAQPRRNVVSPLPAELSEMPGWNEGRNTTAIDCGVGTTSSCIVEAPPGLMAGN
jgi:anti-sigma factor RsiW